MRTLLTLAALAVTATGCGPTLNAHTYTSKHTLYAESAFVEEGEADPEVLEAAGEAHEAEDCLTIKLASDESKLYYSFQFFFPFDHECAMAGMADKVADNLWVQEFQLADADDTMCRLELKRDATGTWTVEDAASCGQEFCGARGTISHQFQASAKGPLKKCGYGN